MEKYNPQKIKSKWQKIWEKKNFYKAKDFSKKPKFYVLIEFPYPSGDGLHVGHIRSYTALDAVARKKRMEGFNVLFPIGWDAFGLPAENYAIKTGIHPSITVKKNIAVFRRQLKSLGLSFDWSREINTTDSEYYKWTQWIFLKLFENDLAYKAKMPINWCPSCKIGLANEEVVDGKCERCGTATEKKEKEQWMLAITKYADRLIEDLDKVNYLEKIKTQQINWIGRSDGTEIKFQIPNSKFQILIFTTRADTIFGVTAIVIAPEHNLTPFLVTPENKSKVDDYIRQSKFKSEFERIKIEKEKTGVFAGSYCINPVNGEKVPIWVGDYVVATYGGGAVMMVPAHDKRDFEFAKKYNLEIKEVISHGNIQKEAFVEYGRLVNSGDFSGLSSEKAIEKITKWLEEKKLGRKVVQYKFRDWVFSRQHYWGEPIPIIHCGKCGAVPVPEKDLPVKLPFIEKYQPTSTGESPLAAISKWVNVKCPKCGGPAKRETDTMPNWAGSSWYYLAYLMRGISNFQFPISKYKKIFGYWMPVDWYNGGMEHTTLHLLYSRFWYKFLYDIGVVPQSEPYARRTSHGMVLAPDGQKMSKSRGNVINPDNIIEKYGADTLRLYEMFMGPFDQMIFWDTKGLIGVKRFLDRVWKLQQKIPMAKPLRTLDKVGAKNKELENLVHKTIKKVGEDIENMKFNTAISSLMILANEMEKQKEISLIHYSLFLILLSPFAPHITEEIWSLAGFKGFCCNQKWPEYNTKLIKEEKITLVVQINGKIRDKIEVEADIKKEKAEELALSSEKIKKWLGGKEVKKIIFIPQKLVNFVVAIDKK